MKNFLIIIILLYCTSGLNSEERKRSVYLGKIQASNVSTKMETQVRNGITLSIIRNLKDKYSVLDDEMVKRLMDRLKIQQLTGCDTEKCEKQLSDALNADYKIEGTITIEGTKHSLTLKLFKMYEENPSLSNQVKKEFNSNQMEYYIDEVTKSLLNPRYVINDKNAPEEINPQKVNLNLVDIKTVQGIDLNILEFKSEDSGVDDLIRYSKKTLNEGDENFKKNEYRKALENYKKIFFAIEKLTPEKQTLATSYKDAVKKRIENTLQNMFANRIKAIDRLPTEKKVSLEVRYKDYDWVLSNYKIEIESINFPEDKSIVEPLEDRKEKVDLAILAYDEKEADLFYENYKFNSAQDIYEKLLETLKSKPSSAGYKNYTEKIHKKLDVTNKTGYSYLNNKIKSYLELVEKKNFQLTLMSDNASFLEKYQMEETISESMKNARYILKKSDFRNKELIDYYNKVSDLVNKGRENNLSKSIDPQTFLKEPDEIDTTSAFGYSLLFPGHGQMKTNPDSFKSNLIYSSGLIFAAASIYNYLYFMDKDASYRNLKLTPTEYAFYGLLPTNYIPFLYQSQVNRFDKRREKRDNAYNNTVASFGLFAFVYVYSLVDIIFFTNRSEELGFHNPEEFYLYKLEKGFIKANASRNSLGNSFQIVNSYKNIEDHFQLFYTYSL